MTIDKLTEAARPLIRVVPFTDHVRQGSAIVAIDNTTVILKEEWVTIPVAFDDLIPVECQQVVPLPDGGSVRLRFYNPQVRGGKATYDCEVMDD